MTLSEEQVANLIQKNKAIKSLYARYMNAIPKGHIGGALSMCECLVALFYCVLRDAEVKDRIIISKGHCSQILYCIACDKGMVSFEEIVNEYNIPGGRFGSHPNRKTVPLIEYSSGALGHGLSVAVGMALSEKARQTSQKRIVYCIVGDGELNEGSNWEAIMSAKQYGLGNLCLIIDKNGYSSSDRVDNIMGIGPLKEKLESFGMNVEEVDGNNLSKVTEVLLKYREWYTKNGGNTPIAIILNTKKGNGFYQIEDEPRLWHNGHIDDCLLTKILSELEGNEGE